MATVRNLACIAFRPEALDVHNLGHSKLFISYFCKVIKKIERIFAKNFARNYEKKNNTWNIRCWVAESFGP
jgi:hypothetical protein